MCGTGSCGPTARPLRPKLGQEQFPATLPPWPADAPALARRAPRPNRQSSSTGCQCPPQAARKPLQPAGSQWAARAPSLSRPGSRGLPPPTGGGRAPDLRLLNRYAIGSRSCGFKPSPCPEAQIPRRPQGFRPMPFPEAQVRRSQRLWAKAPPRDRNPTRFLLCLAKALPKANICRSGRYVNTTITKSMRPSFCLDAECTLLCCFCASATRSSTVSCGRLQSLSMGCTGECNSLHKKR